MTSNVENFSLTPADHQAIASAIASEFTQLVADAIVTSVAKRARAAALLGDDAVVNEEEAAEILASRPKTLQHLRQIGHGPRVVRLSKNRIGYRIADLKAFITAAAR